MKRLLFSMLAVAITSSPSASADPPPYISVWEPTKPGIAYGFAARVERTDGSNDPLTDFTVAGQLTARNTSGVDQWAFGLAAEAWALPGSRSVLVGIEAAVINEEPTNQNPKIANNAVMKNHADGKETLEDPMNSNSIAYWVSAQPGTGFERGLAFDRDSLIMKAGRAAAIDLSDIPDDRIGEIDLIRIRKNVSLRYDPVLHQLILHGPAAAAPLEH